MIFQARWITVASNALRLYMQTPNPDKYLKRFVKFVVNVYASVLFEIWEKTHVTDGPKHMFNLIKRGQKVIPKEDFDDFKNSVLNNNWFLHHELILLSMLADSDLSKRRFAVKFIKEARTNPQAGIREFAKPKEEDMIFDAEEYCDIIDLKNMPKEQMSEPPATFHLSLDELDDIAKG